MRSDALRAGDGVCASLTIAALTNTCAMGMLLGKLPYNLGSSCDLDTIVGQLRDTAPAGTRP